MSYLNNIHEKMEAKRKCKSTEAMAHIRNTHVEEQTEKMSHVVQSKTQNISIYKILHR